MKRVTCTIFTLLLLCGVWLTAEQQSTERVPEVKAFGGFWYAFMDFNGPYSLLASKSEIFKKEFEKQALTAKGPLFITFYNPPSVYKGYELKWAVCYPVDKDTEIKAPLQKRLAPLVQSVILMHTEGDIQVSFDIVQDYIKEQRYEKVWPAYEVYHKNPQGIEVIHPVKK